MYKLIALAMVAALIVSSAAFAGGDGGGRPQDGKGHPKLEPVKIQGGDGGGPKNAGR